MAKIPGLFGFVQRSTKSPLVKPSGVGSYVSLDHRRKGGVGGRLKPLGPQSRMDQKPKFSAREAPNNPSIKQMVDSAGPSKRSPAEIASIKARAKANDPFTTGRTVDLSSVGKKAQQVFANPRGVDPESALFDKRLKEANAKKTAAQRSAQREQVRRESEMDQRRELRGTSTKPKVKLDSESASVLRQRDQLQKQLKETQAKLADPKNKAYEKELRARRDSLERKLSTDPKIGRR